ncbi:dephospho-CoA kinase [Pseudaestuariivita sp.]|uniref:dephospho-CoA kinase n=1 Tax=Pseudaestuariivita sp. TaxID=2211669 RepID=UPI0040595067
MTFRLGLTGSIGMGKSTTAQMFIDAGCALWDADAAVHRLYSSGGAAVPALSDLCPDAIEDGAVSRAKLRDAISADRSLLERIEAIVHPLVQADRQAFFDTVTAQIAVFDIPLLFETGSENSFDAVACVWVDPDIQRARVLARGTMTEAQFDAIRAKQMPIEDKLARAHYHIHTDTLDHARRQVQQIVADIRGVETDA